MDRQVQLIIDESCNPAEVLNALGERIKILTSLISSNENETETLKWVVSLLAGGVTNIADKMRS